MPVKKNLKLNFRPNSKARFLLTKLGYISKRGNIIGERGKFTDFINTLVVRTFENKAILEVEFPRFQIVNKRIQIDLLQKEIMNLALEIQKINDIRAEQEEFRKRLLKKK